MLILKDSVVLLFVTQGFILLFDGNVNLFSMKLVVCMYVCLQTKLDS